MYTILITQEVHCSNKARVLELWAGNDFEGEAIDIKVFKDEEQWEDKDIQTELNAGLHLPRSEAARPRQLHGHGKQVCRRCRQGAFHP